jgi:O-antigen/teichoic acid export membrane protein
VQLTLKNAIHSCCPAILKPVLAKIESSPVGYRLAKGTFWSLAGAAISRGMMLVASIFVARILSKTGFGELGMIQSTVGMFGVFAGFGLGLTATKYVAEFRRADPERTGRIIGLSGIIAMGTGGFMAICLFFFAPWLAVHTINAPHLAGKLQIGTLILFISALNGAQTGALSGFEAFKKIAYVNLLAGLISLPLLVGGAYLGGLTGAVWALVINLGLNWLLNHLALRKEMRFFGISFTYKNCSREMPVLWGFSLPLVLSGAIVGPANWMSNAILVNHHNGYNEMGVLNAANQWYNVIITLPVLIGNVVLPVLSERFGQKDAKQFLKTMFLSIKLNTLIVLPIILLAGFVSPYIMSLYGTDFIDNWPTLVFSLLSAGLFAIETPVGQIITATGKMWVGFAMNVGWTIVFILGTFLLVETGSLGLAMSRFYSYLIHGLWVIMFVIWLVRNRLKFSS